MRTVVLVGAVVAMLASGCDGDPAIEVHPPVDTPVVSVEPISGDHTTVFSGTGQGFTSNGAVTVSATVPDGSPYGKTYPKTADRSGAITWSWQWEEGDPDGIWTISFRDHASDKTASTSLSITESGVPATANPRVTTVNPPNNPTGDRPNGPNPKVSVTPSSGDHTTYFTGTASGFTPNGAVTVSATTPNGTSYPSTYPKTADGTGRFTWSWQWDPGDADGLWTIHFLDRASGRTVSTTLTIAGPTTNPVVSVSPAAGDHTTFFAGTASGFTPNGAVTVSATTPNGTSYPNTYAKTADANGAFIWSWVWEPGDSDGVWTIRFLDHTSSKATNTSITITS